MDQPQRPFLSACDLPTKEEADYLERADFLIRQSPVPLVQSGYETFDDFLASLNSRKRKMIGGPPKVVEAGVEMQCLSGDALKSEHWDAFYRFYRYV